MRQRNWRLVAVGTVLLVLAALFFLSMRDMTLWSDDPAALMRTVGEVAGAVGGISLVMIAFGLIGRKAPVLTRRRSGTLRDRGITPPLWGGITGPHCKSECQNRVSRAGWHLEASMNTSKLLVALALVSTIGAVSAQSFHPSVTGKETTTKPWTAPIGHRQPHTADVPTTTTGVQDLLDQEDASVDRKISGICRGC